MLPWLWDDKKTEKGTSEFDSTRFRNLKDTSFTTGCRSFENPVLTSTPKSLVNAITCPLGLMLTHPIPPGR